jgi:hypothetical protein
VQGLGGVASLRRDAERQIRSVAALAGVLGSVPLPLRRHRALASDAASDDAIS